MDADTAVGGAVMVTSRPKTYRVRLMDWIANLDDYYLVVLLCGGPRLVSRTFTG